MCQGQADGAIAKFKEAIDADELSEAHVNRSMIAENRDNLTEVDLELSQIGVPIGIAIGVPVAITLVPKLLLGNTSSEALLRVLISHASITLPYFRD